MVYEGRKSRGRAKRGGGTLFRTLLWGLVLIVAASLLFPGPAAKARDSLGRAIGVDIGGAMEVFSREAKAKNVFSATKSAFRYAFSADGDEDVPVSAGDTGFQTTAPVTEEPSGTEPVVIDPDIFKDLPLPAHVTEERPRENLVLAGPLRGSVIRGFGYTADANGEPIFHYGIDVRGESQSPVRCVADGTVAAVGESTVFGTYVIVAHPDGVESLYAMLGETPLKEGDDLTAGQTVGTLTEDMFHMELLIDGDYVNPQHYVYRYEP